MTEEEAGELAEECGAERVAPDLFYITPTQLAMFADSVQLDAREACAMVCEHRDNFPQYGYYYAAKIRGLSNAELSGPPNRKGNG